MATKTPPNPRKSSAPPMMRAAAIDRFGPPAALTLHTLPVPELGRNEILIAVHAAAVGVWDTSICDWGGISTGAGREGARTFGNGARARQNHSSNTSRKLMQTMIFHNLGG